MSTELKMRPQEPTQDISEIRPTDYFLIKLVRFQTVLRYHLGKRYDQLYKLLDRKYGLWSIHTFFFF